MKRINKTNLHKLSASIKIKRQRNGRQNYKRFEKRISIAEWRIAIFFFFLFFFTSNFIDRLKSETFYTTGTLHLANFVYVIQFSNQF